jgi:DegV family protein with EDD domain
MIIKIVTDSTCDLPAELVNSHGINVIPMYINFGEQGYQDGIEITRQEFYQRLPNSHPFPTTAAPGVDSFKAVYSRLAEEGADEILSIHVSASLSAVMDVARTAVSEFSDIPVTVYDSDQLSLGTGFQVLEAARAAAKGMLKEDILALLDDLSSRTYVFAALDTLEYLKRSGRMNAFMANLGSILQVKPILTMHAGSPGAERVRTKEKSIRRLIELVEELGPIEKVALVHTNAQSEAADLWQKANHLFVDQDMPLSIDVTPVLGAHLGPGAVGFTCITK